MDSQTILKPIAKIGGTVRTFGIVLIVLGGLSIWAPEVMGMTVSVVVGLMLVLGGILRSTFAWLSPGWGSMFLRSLVGILTVVAGGYMIFNPSDGSQVLAMVLVFYLFADGITSLVFALRLPPAAGGAWVMLSAITSLLVGILLWRQWPMSGELAIGVLIGIKLIVDGIELFGIGASAKAIAD